MSPLLHPAQEDRFVRTPHWLNEDLLVDASQVLRQGNYSGALLDSSSSKKLNFFSKNVYDIMLNVHLKNPTAKDDSSLLYLSYLKDKFSGSFKANRQIPSLPEIVLDAPGLVDDYYLNLIDWSCKDILAVALRHDIYLWKSSDASNRLLTSISKKDDYWSSLSWMFDGVYLALGTHQGRLEIWDTVHSKKVLEMHNADRTRITTINWNVQLLSIGGRDQIIRHFDIRIPIASTLNREGRRIPPLACQSLGQFRYHTHEICGLKWDHSGRFLASGGNDNVLCIWDSRFAIKLRPDTNSYFSRDLRAAIAATAASTPLHVWKDHLAAVKAIDWCPSRSNWIVSGGGTVDRKIMLWDVGLGCNLAIMDTGSQVCNMTWSPFSPNPYSLDNYRGNGLELLTAHGYTQNELTLWKIAPMSPAAEHKHLFLCQETQKSPNVDLHRFIPVSNIKGHSQRVVHMSMNPRSGMVTTGSGDETLRFWRVFGNPPPKIDLSDVVFSESYSSLNSLR